MSPKSRAPFVALATLLRRRYPVLADPGATIAAGQVLVDGAPIANPSARVRADASVRILRRQPLRGTVKLQHALQELDVDVGGVVALDIGAAAGGFTEALLQAGTTRVYAVDAGVGQLRGWLRADPRVVNLEGTNLGSLGPDGDRADAEAHGRGGQLTPNGMAWHVDSDPGGVSRQAPSVVPFVRASSPEGPDKRLLHDPPPRPVQRQGDGVGQGDARRDARGFGRLLRG